MKTAGRTAGTGGVFQRGATFWIRYSHRGKQFRESSRSTKRSDAVKLLRKRLGEIGAGRLVGPDAERTSADDLWKMLLDDYRLNGRKSIERAEDAIGHLEAFFTFDHVPDLTGDRVSAYIRHRQGEKAASATIRYECAILRRALTLAWRSGKAASRPYIPSVSVNNARKGFFEEAEMAAVEQHLSEALRPVMRFAYFTGWRVRSEVLPLTWDRVDLTAGVVRLEPGTTKNDEGREFPFSAYPQLGDLLRDQHRHTKAVERAKGQIIRHVFHRNGKPIKDYRGAWQRACAAVGLRGRLVHDFRRTAVRNLERAGVSRSVAMKLTGHKTEAVYRRCAVVSTADLSEGVAKLAALHGARTSDGNVVPFPTRQAQS